MAASGFACFLLRKLIIVIIPSNNKKIDVTTNEWMFSLVHVHDRRGVMKKFSKNVPKLARKFYFLMQPLYHINNLFLFSLSLKERL